MSDQNEVKIYLSRKKLIRELFFYAFGLFIGIFLTWLYVFFGRKQELIFYTLLLACSLIMISLVLWHARLVIKSIVKKLQNNTPICILSPQGFNFPDSPKTGLIAWRYIREVRVEKAPESRQYLLLVYLNEAGFGVYKEPQYMLDISNISLELDELEDILSIFNVGLS